ncbi:MAG: chemotaxis protein CheB, partial [Gemmatimonadota bacterium]
MITENAIKRDIIVIGASAGGVEAFSYLLEHLPADFPAAIAMTLHRSPVFPSLLPKVLNQHANLKCEEPKDGDAFKAGHAYVAPPDHHMVVRQGLLRLERGPKHHHSRPAIDPMFQSVAVEYGDRVIGVLLTGNLSDGVAGLIAI